MGAETKVLETKAVYISQTGEAIAAEIAECLEVFGIREKVVGRKVDNAANMTVGAANLNVFRLPCFAHSMNLAAGKLYSCTALTRWLAKIFCVVVFFKRVHMASVVPIKKQMEADKVNRICYEDLRICESLKM